MGHTGIDPDAEVILHAELGTTTL